MAKLRGRCRDFPSASGPARVQLPQDLRVFEVHSCHSLYPDGAPFYGQVTLHCMHTPQFVLDGHLGCFHFETVLSHAAEAVGGPVSVWTWALISLGPVPRSGIAEPYGTSTLSFLRYLQPFSRAAMTNDVPVTSPAVMVQSLILGTNSLTLSVASLLPTWGPQVRHVALLLISRGGFYKTVVQMDEVGIRDLIYVSHSVGVGDFKIPGGLLRYAVNARVLAILIIVAHLEGSGCVRMSGDGIPAGRSQEHRGTVWGHRGCEHLSGTRRAMHEVSKR